MKIVKKHIREVKAFQTYDGKDGDIDTAKSFFLKKFEKTKILTITNYLEQK